MRINLLYYHFPSYDFTMTTLFHIDVKDTELTSTHITMIGEYERILIIIRSAEVWLTSS